jgi:hypothetical protein
VLPPQLQNKAVPFDDKLHAIAYINTNCHAQSGRSDIMRALMRLGDKLKVSMIFVFRVFALGITAC